MTEKQKIYKSKEEAIAFELKRVAESLSKQLDQLPNIELPFMEPHLRALYFETYFLLADGFYNAALVLSGILLETLIKQRLFLEGFKDEELENMDFGKVIEICKEKKFLTPEEIAYLEIRRIKLRNPYAHYNMIKLSEGIYYDSFKVEKPVEKIISLQEKVNNGELTNAQAQAELIKGITPKTITSKDFRPLAHIAKNMLEETGLAMSTFLDIDRFVRNFASKYFKTDLANKSL